MRAAVESVPSTHPESATAKRGTTTAKTSAMKPAASKTASAAMEAATASAAVPSASCRGGVISCDKEQRTKNQRKERNELRPANRHGTLRYNGQQEAACAGPAGAKPESIH